MLLEGVGANKLPDPGRQGNMSPYRTKAARIAAHECREKIRIQERRNEKQERKRAGHWGKESPVEAEATSSPHQQFMLIRGIGGPRLCPDFSRGLLPPPRPRNAAGLLGLLASRPAEFRGAYARSVQLARKRFWLRISEAEGSLLGGGSGAACSAGALAGAACSPPQPPQVPQAVSQTVPHSQQRQPNSTSSTPCTRHFTSPSRHFTPARMGKRGPQQVSQVPQAFSQQAGAGQAFSQQAGAGQAFSQAGAQAGAQWRASNGRGQAFSQQAGSGAQVFAGSQQTGSQVRQGRQANRSRRPANRSQRGPQLLHDSQAGAQAFSQQAGAAQPSPQPQ